MICIYYPVKYGTQTEGFWKDEKGILHRDFLTIAPLYYEDSLVEEVFKLHDAGEQSVAISRSGEGLSIISRKGTDYLPYCKTYIILWRGKKPLRAGRQEYQFRKELIEKFDGCTVEHKEHSTLVYAYHNNPKDDVRILVSK